MERFDLHENAVESLRDITPRSRALHDRARARIPGGVSSSIRFFPPYPIFMKRAAGARIWDVDGRDYLDYCLGFGPMIAGHGHPRVHEAIVAELTRNGTTLFGAPTELEFTLADRLARLIPSAEMTRFTNSGSEATMHALRLARGATGRSRIVKFEGHYHGVHDSVLFNIDRPGERWPASDGIPRVVADGTIVAPFNDVAALTRLLEHTPDIAAVIVEPVARGAIEADPVFLTTLRRLTAERGIVLIFDEVVSWPRVSLGGAQALFGVTPDLTALGKAIGGGLPMGALVGRRALMSMLAPPASRGDVTPAVFADAREDEQDDAADALAPASRTPPPARHVFHSGTYNASPTALAAGLAVLDLLEEGTTYDVMTSRAAHARSALRDLFATRGRAAQVIGVGAAFDFYFTETPIRSSREIWSSDLETRRALDYRLLEAGVYNSPLHRFHLSIAHGDGDIEQTLDAIARALDG